MEVDEEINRLLDFVDELGVDLYSWQKEMLIEQYKHLKNTKVIRKSNIENNQLGFRSTATFIDEYVVVN